MRQSGPCAGRLPARWISASRREHFTSKKGEMTRFHEKPFHFANHIIFSSGNLNSLVKSIEVNVCLSYVFASVC